MRRRRKPKVVWLPHDTTDSIRADGRSTIHSIQIALDNTTVGNTATIETPVVGDFLPEAVTTPPGGPLSLADIEQSGYRLRRIVGKIFVNTASDTNVIETTTNSPLLVVSAGFMVRRVDEATGISLASNAGQAAVVDTFNTRDPWIWRRTWAMATPQANAFGAQQFQAGAAGNGFIGQAGVPANNWAHGPALLDGPHVDAKTARIIGPEERLVLNLSATAVINGANNAEIIVVTYDLRFLGSMRSNVGNRRNSSR